MRESEHFHSETPVIDYHLEYLDEFLQLRCAPDMIAMGLFPNAKEITETYAAWSAVRRHILPHLSNAIFSSDNGRRNAIIVVGDGMTPRTAALCAYMTKGEWDCYSIDPMLQYDSYVDMTFISRRSITTVEHCRLWKTIEGLRMARAKIQTISVQCQKAIVVLMHAHVKNDDAIKAVDASEGIVGLVACPCCEWIPFQQQLFGQAPHRQYQDLRLLSTKNYINVWCFPQGFGTGSSIEEDNNTSNEAKQRSTERNIWGIDISMIDSVLSSRHGVKQRASELWSQIYSFGVMAFNPTDMLQQLNDFDVWQWALTTWSPKDIIPFMESCKPSNDPSTLPSWFRKPILLVGTIAAVRRCKYTIFYGLSSCTIPSDSLEKILKLTCCPLTMSKIAEQQRILPDGTFPALLKSADRIWSCVEYQRHLQAISAYDQMAERRAKTRNLLKDNHGTEESSKDDRVNVILSLLSYNSKNNYEPPSKEITCANPQTEDSERMKLFYQNPQPRESLFPWATQLRPGDILVAYCELGRNAMQGPQLCIIDAILLFDTMLHMIGVDRRILR